MQKPFILKYGGKPLQVELRGVTYPPGRATSRARASVEENMTELTEVLTKIYGFTNRMKVNLAFKDIDAAFNTLNELTEYLVSIDVGIKQDETSLLDFPSEGTVKRFTLPS